MLGRKGRWGRNWLVGWALGLWRRRLRRGPLGIVGGVVEVGFEVGRVGILVSLEVWCRRTLGERWGSSRVGLLPLRPAR